MSGFWLNLLGSGGLVVLLLAIIKFVENRMSLRASRPRTAAETADALANANKTNAEAAGETIRQLREQNTVLSGTVEKLSRRVDDMETKLDHADEQADLMGRQLQAANETIQTLRQENRDLKKKVDVLSRQVQSNYDADHPAP